MATLLDGKKLSSDIREQLLKSSNEISPILGRRPKLAVILVGDNPASKIYVASKTKAAESCGIDVLDFFIDSSIIQVELEKKITEIANMNDVDGILMQLPLPKHLDEKLALACIPQSKDVDGLTSENQGYIMRGDLSTPEGSPVFCPCTPKGLLKLIDLAFGDFNKEFDLAGKLAVVVGRSILVGRPAGMMLLNRNCTVLYAHSKSSNLKELCSQADILVAAVGRPEMFDESYIKKGAIVIDVGINRLEEGPQAGKIVGDVKFDSVKEVASAITPVPGGVGPMTIAMLMENVISSAKSKINL